MAGHSKWAQIKRGKAVTDAAKSRTFSRFARLIALESKKASGSVSSPALAAVITRAKAANMPKENIERAIAKGISKDAGELEQVVYETYGPGGVAVVTEVLTDARNRTTQEIKLILTKKELGLAAPGAALWAFTKTPDGALAPNEPLMEIAGDDETKLGELLSALDEHDDVQAVYTNARGYESTKE
jgi:transcriptional/translational regulatory protein YebC/TACO1